MELGSRPVLLIVFLIQHLSLLFIPGAEKENIPDNPWRRTGWRNVHAGRCPSRVAETEWSFGRFAQGGVPIESLERFVRKEPLRRVHEAVFGVLALESEPVDPRL